MEFGEEAHEMGAVFKSAPHSFACLNIGVRESERE